MFKKLYLAFIKLLPVLFSLLIILIGIKGYWGNPKISDLNTRVWQDNGPFELSPERGRFALLYSIVEDKSFQFSVEVARFVTPDLGYKNGKFVSLFAPGLSIILIPGYIIGKFVGASQLGASLTIGLFALLNMYLIYLLAQKFGADKTSSYISAILFVAGTPAFSYAGSIYQHHISVFFILLCLYLSKVSVSGLKLSFIYILSIFSILIDYPNAFFLLPILIYATFRYITVTLQKGTLNIVIPNAYPIVLSTILVPLSVFFYINFVSYGNYFQLSSTVTHIQALDKSGKPIAGVNADQRSVDEAQNLTERKRNAFTFFKPRHMVNGLYILFFSQDRGIIYYAPIMLIGMYGLYTLIKKKNELSPVILAIIGINILIYAMRRDVWGGWAFGSRYLIPSYALLSITLALSIPKKRVLLIMLFIVISVYSISVNTLGAITSNTNPPQPEVLQLEKISGTIQKYTYEKNWDMLVAGKTKSAFYDILLKNMISPMIFYKISVGAISLVLAVLLLRIFFTKKAYDH